MVKHNKIVQLMNAYHIVPIKCTFPINHMPLLFTEGGGMASAPDLLLM